MTQEQILELIYAKDERGLMELAGQYDRLLAYVVGGILAGRKEDIEECINDTYLKFWRHAEEFDLQRASLPTYLKVIARNTAINRLRDIKRAEEYLSADEITDIAEEYADANTNVEKTVLQKEKLAYINELLKELPERDREMMLRRYFYLQSSKTIAKAMHTTANAVDSKLSRLRVKVKQECDRWNED